MQIFVDADACPVVRIVEKIAEKYIIPCDDVLTDYKKLFVAKSANILANVALSSFLLAVALPKLTFVLRKKVTGSDAEPGLMTKA